MLFFHFPFVALSHERRGEAAAAAVPGALPQLPPSQLRWLSFGFDALAGEPSPARAA
jgi:hypothetical protein